MDDGTLAQAAQRGDRDAYGQLVRRHQGRVFGLCFVMTSSAADAEDLAHEAFVEAWLKLAQLREPAKFAPWLRQVALNVCRQWYRQARRRPLALPAEPPADEGEPEDEAVDVERMLRRLADLSAPHRLVLVLHYLEGLSYRQTAVFLDVPVGTVMSRLHRARRALKRLLDAPRETPEPQEPPQMEPHETFREEVDAEIAVLLAMSGGKPAAERLGAILRRSPERVARLIREAGDEATRANLAVLLPRLGPPAARIALDCRLADDADAAAAERAGAVLRGTIARAASLPAGGWHPPMPGRGAYFVLDGLIQAGADAGRKADLLLDWLDACDGGAALLVANVLLCYRGAAVPRLMDRFAAFADADDVYASADVLHALCRTGKPFCEALADELPAAEPPRLGAVLAAVEAVARCVEPRPWLDEADERAWTEEVRQRRKWPPLRRRDVGDGLLARLIDRTAERLDHGRADVRESALRALGRFRAAGQADAIVARTTDEEASVRLAAIRALADLGGADCADVLAAAAEEGAPAERLAAVEAIGRLGVRSAQALLVRLADDPDRRVQAAAVIALGELGGPEADAVLAELLRTGGNTQRKAAARALYRAKRTGVFPTPSPAARALRQKIRGDASPQAYSSLDAAVRALPELRAYDEREITRRLAEVCIDHSLTRRRLIDCGLMTRADGTYALTPFGQAAWRVEHFILRHYVQRARR